MNAPRIPFATIQSGASAQSASERSIGAVLIDAGRISHEEADLILRRQRERNVRFGDAAIELGILTDEDIRFALSHQFEHTSLAVGDPAMAPEVVTAFQPNHQTAEAIRHLRTQLLLRWFDGTPTQRCVAIVGAERGTGRSFIAANLAVAFAQMGERTLLIDADLRRPDLHRLFRIDARAGLSTVLSGRADVDVAHPVASFGELSVLPCGPIPPNPQELLSRASFPRLMADASKLFDVVIVDTPSCESGADAQIVAARAGAAVLVARQDHTQIRNLAHFVQSLRSNGTQLLGSVANQF